jgi:O-antigen/teichoic acid export membrane protein
MSLVLSRALGPSGYGAMAALLALAVVGAIPAQAEQFVAARQVAQDRDVRPGTARAWRLGVLLALACVVLSVPAANWLSLPSRADLALLGLVLLPLTVLGVHQGALLGAQRTIAYGAVLLSLTGGRLLAAGAALASGGGVTAVLGAAATVSWLTLAVTSALTRGHLSRHGGSGWRELAASVSTVACVFVITNIDVVAARILLPSVDSGVYAVAGLFARVAFWGPYVVVLVVFPLVSRGEGGRRLLAQAIAVTVVAGVLLAALAVPLAEPFITATSGPRYADAARLAPWMALLGTLGGLLQLLLLHALARQDRTVEVVVWIAALAEAGLLAVLSPHLSGGIIAVATGVQLVAAVSAAAWEWRASGRKESV